MRYPENPYERFNRTMNERPMADRVIVDRDDDEDAEIEASIRRDERAARKADNETSDMIAKLAAMNAQKFSQ